MKINPDRIIGFIVITLALASGVVLILISRTYEEKLDILWKRYDDPDLAKKLALVLGVALVVGAILFFFSSACWLWIFDSADEKKKRKYRKKVQQRRLAKAKSQSTERRQSSEQSQRSAPAVEPTEVRAVGATAPGGARATPSCPPEAALDVHDPLMYANVRDPMHPPPYESVIMQECMKFPFADEV